jgi:hypothetical protein
MSGKLAWIKKFRFVHHQTQSSDSGRPCGRLRLDEWAWRIFVFLVGYYFAVFASRGEDRGFLAIAAGPGKRAADTNSAKRALI